LTEPPPPRRLALGRPDLARIVSELAGGPGAHATRRLLSLASDERLTQEIRRGNEAAFEALYERHCRGLLAMCRHILGLRDEAEEAVQHAFAAAWSELQRGDRPTPELLKPWLYAIARHRSLSMLRARKPATLELNEVPSTAGLADVVGQRADLRALLADLRDLPEEQRTALVLSELRGLSHSDIADVLDRKEAGVKALVYQARTTLADWREAREAPCAEIREQLSVLRGGSLRRRSLRRHLQACTSCQAFRAEVQAQRRKLAILLPVAPALGLKGGVLGAAGAGAATGGTGASGGAALAVGAATAGSFGSAPLATVAIVGVLAGVGSTTSEIARGSDHSRSAAADSTNRSAAAPAYGLPALVRRGDALPALPFRRHLASTGRRLVPIAALKSAVGHRPAPAPGARRADPETEAKIAKARRETDARIARATRERDAKIADANEERARKIAEGCRKAAGGEPKETQAAEELIAKANREADERIAQAYREADEEIARLRWGLGQLISKLRHEAANRRRLSEGKLAPGAKAIPAYQPRAVAAPAAKADATRAPEARRHPEPRSIPKSKKAKPKAKKAKVEKPKEPKKGKHKPKVEPGG
jgi:RNA polymerase sigma factor (sigma-70 family)